MSSHVIPSVAIAVTIVKAIAFAVGIAIACYSIIDLT